MNVVGPRIAYYDTIDNVSLLVDRLIVFVRNGFTLSLRLVVPPSQSPELCIYPHRIRNLSLASVSLS
jgi:hypothetical protein